MHKFSLSLFTLSLSVALMPLAHAANTPAQQHLLEQVRLGEASNREDLVRQSLYRLELIDPNNPDVVAARMRYLLRQGDTAGAQKQLERLAKLAPDSTELKTSRNEMDISTGDEIARLRRVDNQAHDAGIALPTAQQGRKLRDQCCLQGIDTFPLHIECQMNNAGRFDLDTEKLAHSATSQIMATPKPPAAQAVVNPSPPPRRRNSRTVCKIMRAPVAANGCP